MKTDLQSGASVSLDAEDNSPNANRTMQALREMGYSSYASVLDLIDNSIDAGATHVDVTIEKNADDIVITITDDGDGMTREGLSEALRLGSESAHEPTDLGKFGMGLVTASIGLSKRVEVVSKVADGPAFLGWFDLEEIAQTNKWLKHVGSPTAEQAARLGDTQSGTSVKVSKSDRITNRNTTQFADILRKEIAEAYRKFIGTKRLRIAVNELVVSPIDPLMLQHPKTEVKLAETELRVDGKVVATVKVVELPDLGAAENRSLGISPRNAGFYVLRNNRQITAAQFFEMAAKHPTLSHFRGEISFDGNADHIMHTDVKKGTVIPSQAFLDVLKGVVGGLITASSAADKRRADESRGKIDHSIVEAAVPRKASLIPKPSAWVEKRERNGSDKESARSGKKGTEAKPRTPRTTQFKTPSGLKVEFREGNYRDAFFYLVSQEGSTLVITYNRDHNFWNEYASHGDSPKVVALVDYLIFALANAEQMVGSDAMESVKANMNAALVGVLS